MKVRYFVAAAALSASAAALAAGDGETLFKQNNCAVCHLLDGKSVGPALLDIAAKYRGDKGAQARLETKLRNGGAGSFGSMPQPATARSVSDADIKTMVAWILSQK